MNMANKMMIEFMSFIMLHLQSSCTSCNFEKEEIMSELRRRPDFLQVVKVEKKILQVDSFLAGSLSQGDMSGTICTVYDWDSLELASILSTFSSNRCRENCVYLLEVLDKFWDDYYSAKARSLTNVTHCGEDKTVESSFMNCIRSFKWIASSMDEDLHYATDLFYDFEDVRSLLGSVAPYAVPQVSSRSLVKDIGFKTKVSHSDALMILNTWIAASQVPFSASMGQMCKFHTFMSEGVADAKIDVKREFLSCSSIFTPLCRPRFSEVVPGKFLSPKDLYWHDPTGCCEMTKEFISTRKTGMFPRRMLSAAYPSLCEFFTEACGVPKVPMTSDYVEILLQLWNAALPSQVSSQVSCFYAGSTYDYVIFVCRRQIYQGSNWLYFSSSVFCRYFQLITILIVLNLKYDKVLPVGCCKVIFPDLHSVSDKMNDILFLKESLQKLETTILPTLVDKWVSLHPSFGLVCWVDDDELKQHFENYSDVDFIQFGELSYEDKQMLYGRVAVLMKSLGIPALSKTMPLSTSSTPSFNLRSILEKEKLSETNFIDWYRNLRIVLKQEKKKYILEVPYPDEPAEDATHA